MEDQITKKELLLDITMRIVAESGLLSFSMKQVTSRAGVSEALIYRHYQTKDNLLYQCFKSVDSQIAALFTEGSPPELHSEMEFYGYIRNMWMTYFTFLVENDYKTIYYFEYRNSPYIKTVLEHGYEAGETYFKGFTNIFHVLNKDLHVLDKVSSDYLWTYVLDVTGLFARRVIRGELPKSAESYETVWMLFFSGISGIIRG